MGERMQHFNWASTTVGSPDQWSASLKSLIQLMLHSKVPMFIWWGEDLIQFYNDAYRNFLTPGNRHPDYLGQSAYQCWPEAWSIIKPLIDQVLAGEGVWMENLMVPHYRYGKLLDTYWTFGYSPLYDTAEQPMGVLVTCTDTTQMILSQQQLEASEALNQQLFHSSPVGKVVFWGEDLAIQMINESMLTLMGTDRSIMGKPLAEAIPELVNTPIVERLREVLASGNRYSQPEEKFTFQRHGHSYTGYYQYTFTALKDEFGVNTGIITTVIEITEQVRARQIAQEGERKFRQLSEHLEQLVQARTLDLEVSNEELTASNEELQQLNEQLNLANDRLQQFAYVASHDLQEPLRKIQAFSSMLSQKYVDILDDAGLDSLARMNKAGEQMSSLITDLLAYSRLISSAETFKLISLHRVLNNVLETLEFSIEQTRASIYLEPLPTLRGDEMQLGQLFQNLISNALKFTRPGEAPVITIQTRLVSRREVPEKLKLISKASRYHCISVKDQGVGFDSQYADRIFVVFERLHSKQEFSGTGIGLAICQRVVENHGGAIVAESQPSQGAVFHVYLPD